MLSKSAAERVLYAIGRPLVRTFYRVSTVGLDNLPDGGFLLVPNHISWVDALVLQLACPRPIRYVIDQEYYHKPVLHPILRALGCIPINIRRDGSHSRNPSQRTQPGESARRRCGAKSPSSERICRRANRDRFASQQRIDAREPRRDHGKQSSC